MPAPFSRALRGAIVLVAASLAASQAHAHAVAGDRIFPATLGIDDPGVGDELALPTLAYAPTNSDGVEEFDASLSYTKTILPGLGLSITDGITKLRPGGTGWGNLDTELKYNFFVDGAHEFMASLGADVTWANTGSPNFSDPFNTYTPVLDIGKGFGDLPTSLNFLRPLAVTAEFSVSFPSESMTQGTPNPTTFNYGFTVQYSLPYYNSHVGELSGDFFKHLIPITEFTFSTPIANIPSGGTVTTGTIQPGVIYMSDKWQLALEAVIPINGASGHGVGAVGELHFFFDDIFPNSLGKPLFGGL